jgi:hypothetical protein
VAAYLVLRERCGLGVWQNAGKRETKPSFSRGAAFFYGKQVLKHGKRS